MLNWGVLVQVPFRTVAVGDSRAKESIRSNFFVDNGKIDVDRSSGNSLGDSGEEQSKVEKLQHREWMRENGNYLAWGNL